MSWIIAGATIGSGLLGAFSSNSAANQQVKAANRATDLQREIFDKSTALQEPFRQSGITAQNRIMELLGLGGNTGSSNYGYLSKQYSPDMLTQDPGYRFRLDEGMKALNNSAAARGGLQSGNALKAATQYGQNYASGEYNNAFNRDMSYRNSLLQPLQSLYGGGMSAANTVGSLGQNYANTVGDYQIQKGNVGAAATMAGTNALTGGINQYLNYNNNTALLNALRGG